MEERPVEILLIEDNPNDVELTLDALKENNLANHIQVARDGVEALDYLFRRGEFAGRNNGNPRLVLLDLKLPRVNGLEVLQQIRADPSTRSTPVVVLTSSNEEHDIMESYNLGVNSYIVKPVDFEKFTNTVRHLGFYWLLLNQLPDK